MIPPRRVYVYKVVELNTLISAVRYLSMDWKFPIKVKTRRKSKRTHLIMTPPMRIRYAISSIPVHMAVIMKITTTKIITMIIQRITSQSRNHWSYLRRSIIQLFKKWKNQPSIKKKMNSRIKIIKKSRRKTQASKKEQRIMGIMKVVEALGLHKECLIHHIQKEGDQEVMRKIHHTNLKKDQVINFQKTKTFRKKMRRKQQYPQLLHDLPQVIHQINTKYKTQALVCFKTTQICKFSLPSLLLLTPLSWVRSN